jgi:NDP-mannose synthase
MSDLLSKRAVILAGGLGTRLRPYTVVLPKPLMPLGDYPILEIIVRQLAAQGFGRITMAVNHQAHLIKAFFEDGGRWGVSIDYSLESAPLSTIGPLKLIRDLPEHFLLLNGDVLTDLDFAGLWQQHLESGACFTIAGARRGETIDYGVLDVENGALRGFEEKPTRDFVVSMGVYMVNRALLANVPEGRYGFDDLMRDTLARGVRVDVKIYDGYWLDIGRPADYAKAVDDFESGRRSFLRS